MGSKFSKAIWPRAKVVALVAPASSQHHDIDDTNETTHQDPAPQLLSQDPNGVIARRPLSYDDLYIATSTALAPAHLRRRNSEASQSVLREGTRIMEQTLLSSFEQFVAEQQLLNIEWEAPFPPAQGPRLLCARPPPIQPPPEQGPQCLICCTNLPKEKELNYIKEVIKPCRNCNSEYCTSCIKKMFVDACKDMARMPPRCCVPVNLHHAKPYLTNEEANLFRAKYEEWSTPKPFYCPVPTCSTFMPNKLLPLHTKDKQRVDSGIGAPTSEMFACPTCEAGICMECRQPAHPGSICNIHEFGIDAETAALLTSWGYKRCPKCGNGLKRMFGCNHMECRCGAHFCWVCMKNLAECTGGCYEDEESDDEFDGDEGFNGFDDDDEPGGPIEHAVSITDGEMPTPGAPVTRIASENIATPPQAIPLPRNLDGGGASRWEDSSLFFGEEPSNDFQDRAWDCDHSFSEYKISFATVLTAHTMDMECVCCWTTVHPQIQAPYSRTEKIVPAASTRAQDFGVRGGRGLRRGRGGYVLLRGLFRADATVSTAPHLTTSISPLSQSVPARETSPMEDVRFDERIVDTYGNVITTTPVQLVRRASANNSDSLLAFHETSVPTKSSCLRSIFATPPPSSAFNLAHECSHCNILVCESCRDSAIVAQEAREKKKQERWEEQDRERQERELAEANAAITLDGPSDGDEMEMAPPSLFD